MNTQLIIILVTFGIFGIIGFAMSRSIKKFEMMKSKAKKKKGKNKYMPEAKRPGR